MQFAEANRRVHAAVSQLAREGAADEDLAAILMAYSLGLALRAHGAERVSAYLEKWRDRFAAGERQTFEEIACSGVPPLAAQPQAA